jgi:predicted porin
VILKRPIASVSMVVWLTVPAQAGDASLKDPIPDNLTWHGVTVYGAVDVDYTYQTHGAPFNGAFGPGLEYNISGSKNANKPVSSLGESATGQSKFGLTIEEPVGNGWTAIGKAEGAFNPLSGEISDACASMVQNNGKPLATQSANANSSRCGQLFSGPAYAGAANAAYGTLTAGRQQSVELDAIAIYDPMALTAAFSLIGSAGGAAAGFGSTEPSRWDNSVKYIYQYGPAHAAAMYSSGGADTAMYGGGYGFDAGAAYGGFSIDAVYTTEKSIVSTSPVGYATSGANGICNATGVGGGTTCPAGDLIDGTIEDSEGWSVMGKYTYDFAALEGPAAKLSFFAGYVHTALTNPQESVATGSATIGGYRLFYANNMPFAADSARILQTVWTGAKYEFPSGLSFSSAYYYQKQDAYLSSAAPGANNCAYITAANKANHAYVGSTTASNCAGDLYLAAFLANYPLNKHTDLYSGINYSQVGGGLGSGYLNNNMTAFVSGVRLKF